MNKLRLFILSILIMTFNPLESYSQGLQFYGNEKSIAERSSLSIPGDDNTDQATMWKVKFSLRIHNIASPGNIFHIRNTSGKDSFTLSSILWNDTVTFILAKDNEKSIFSTKYNGGEIIDKPIPVEFSLNTTEKTTDIRIGSTSATIPLPELSGIPFSPRIYFGMANHMVECASFSIKDLRILSDGKEIIIPLCENIEENVHDSQGSLIGKVSNPKWLISRSYNWNKVWETSSRTPSGIAFDPKRHLFFSYASDSIKVFNSVSKDQRSMAWSGDSLPVKLGMNVVVPSSGKIIPYEIYHDAFFAEIAPADGKWKELNTMVPRAVLHHHANAYREKDNSLFIFGGYGNRAYSGVLIKYDLSTNSWDTIPLSGDRIDPRFFSSMMLSQTGDSIYIYGGKGNPAGNQDIGIKYYYDLHLIDLKNRKVRKLWEHKAPDEDMVPSRQLIPSSDRTHFYALTYSEYKPHTTLHLQRINISDGSSETVGDTIPMVSEEIATNVAIYEDKDLETIYCITQVFEKMGENKTTVYSISSPPVSADMILSSGNGNGGLKERFRYTLVIIIIAILTIGVVLAATIILRARLQKGDKSTAETAFYPAADKLPESLPQHGSVSAESKTDYTPYVDPISPDISQFEFPDRNRISIFGTFCIIDAKGRDITYLFSPKQKLIFLYLLLNSIEKNGVSSSALSSVFWSDKDKDKVKNLRNVTISKLRKILSDIEGVELVFNQGMFRLNISEICYCDYIRLHSLTSALQNQEKIDEEDEINHILLQGNFIAGVDDPAFDYFRQNMEEFMINYLTIRIQRLFRCRRYDAAQRICRVLSKIDPLSETALKFAVRSLKAIGQHDKARDTYNKFVEGHIRMLGEKCNIKFEDI